MSPQLASIIYVVGILGLFWLDRDWKTRTSKALWIAIFWLLINGSRPVSSWFDTGPTVETMQRQYMEGSPMDAAIYGALVAAGLATLAARWSRVAPYLRKNWPILVYFSYCALSVLWSDYTFVAMKRWVKAIGDLVMALVVLTDTNPLAAVKRFLCRAGFVLLPVSILFIKYYPNLGRSYNPWTWIPMYCGVTTFKNLLGMTCLVCGLGSLWAFIEAWQQLRGNERLRHLLAHGAILGMTVWLFWIADSMTSLVCFILASTVMVLTSFSQIARRRWLVHAMVAGVIGLALTALFLDTGGSMVQSLGRDPTLTGRTAIWNAVIKVSQHPLIGHGFETFWLGDRMQRVWDLSGQEVQEAHDGYIEVYLNLGYIGVALLLVVIVTGYRNALAVFRRDSRMGRLKLAYFVTGVVYGFTEAGFRMLCPVWIAFLMACMRVPRTAAAKKAEVGRSLERDSRAPQPMREPVAALKGWV